MTAEEIAPGLWRWTADPRPGDPEVACAYLEGRDAVVLIDPQVPAAGRERERFWRALDQDVARLGLPVAVLLTLARHVRSSAEVRDRYADRPGVSVYAPAGAAERLSGGVLPVRPGDPLPGAVEALPAGEQELAFWIPEHRALVVGDAIVGAGGGALRRGTRGGGASPAPAELARLLDLPVERVLTAHGPPVLAGARDALARALG
jgi:glyoxylase-like metal-dependent hydrolase (beta-lactamase superfamily II)